MHLYEPQRLRNMFVQFVGVFEVSIFSGLIILAFFYYIQDAPYSRKLLLLFIIMLFVGLVFSHLLTIVIMRRLRMKGYNLRFYAVIGAGQKGQQLVREINQMGWMGLRCAFFLDNDPSCIGTKLLGIPVYGPVEKLTELAKTKTIDEVYLALNGDEALRAYPLLKTIQTSGTTIRIIPDWCELASISDTTAITIGSQVLVSATDSPLAGANVVLKEIFDRTIALLLLVIFVIPMAMIGVLIKLTSKGPILYKQTRVGIGHKEFKILKFRTMVIDAEEGNSHQWTKRNDPRCTRIGARLRRISLDELPQLVNVLKGDMSLVGPRPERSVFAQKFSEEYRKYMLRNKVKAGMTGWAQINGFRGDTSLRKRLLYDLYYVRNWSFGLDIWILLRTPWHILKGENAY